MNYIKKISTVFLLIFVFAMSYAHADDEVRIVIDEGVDSAKPIAVVPFKWNGPGVAPDNIAQIISDDFRNSGKFTPLSVDKMPQKPTSAAEVIPDEWLVLGIDAIVVGQITPKNGGYDVAYQLVDTIGTDGKPGAVLQENSYFVPNRKAIRFGAHTISDAVFEKLTGIRGAFRTKIAYVVQRYSGSKPYELQVSDYDGYNKFVVNRSSLPIMSPAWSKDGKSLAYVSFEGAKARLVMQKLATGERKIESAYPGHNGAPAFSPDGNLLAFTSSKDGVLNIYVKNLTTGQVTQLTRGSGNNTEPSWSANGQEIAFTSDRSGSPQVYIMGANGGSATLVGVGSRSYSGEFGPDGKYLYMISNDHLIKKELSTGTVEALATTFLDESPSVSPNGLMVIYSSTQGVGKVLQLVSTDGRFKARLPGVNGQAKYPAWSPYLTQQ